MRECIPLRVLWYMNWIEIVAGISRTLGAWLRKNSSGVWNFNPILWAKALINKWKDIREREEEKDEGCMDECTISSSTYQNKRNLWGWFFLLHLQHTNSIWGLVIEYEMKHGNIGISIDISWRKMIGETNGNTRFDSSIHLSSKEFPHIGI